MQLFVGVYLICILATSMLSLIVTILNLRLFHHDASEPVPDWLKGIIRFMATITCQTQELRNFHYGVSSQAKPEVDIKKTAEVNDKPVQSVQNGLAAKPEVSNGNCCDVVAAERIHLPRRSPWESSARIFDRFFAVLFLLVVLVVNIVMIGIIPLYA